MCVQAQDSTVKLDCKYELMNAKVMQGMSISLKLPCNWHFDDSNPKALAVITGVSRRANVIVGVMDFVSASIALTDEEIDTLLSDEDLRAATRHSGTFISCRRMEINGYRTGEVLVKAKNQVKGVIIYSYKVYNYIYFSNGTILLSFSIFSRKEDKAKTEFFKRIELLRSIANQISIRF